mmetsp:Transcript_27793/g.52889  ORF Transcript_27793/g.52889 Transcript_27793/m.52889 type:complete len:91 (+) Transcript_27793:880-1152(+)|eukprot:CAMPEP_0114319632 /NCGR_PEP_ID=MMETSP0059-20121206/25367_1 /TAXON_ID=36894 /ORGANISM="Pyramimonas parkeae, Strain CCMP726" /LENGTH=90 /DNA_ID=CAMNT_0001446697 /DNA_START=707 /DNA_END=979 /DNA_ORIENTATION=-
MVVKARRPRPKEPISRVGNMVEVVEQVMDQAGSNGLGVEEMGLVMDLSDLGVEVSGLRAGVAGMGVAVLEVEERELWVDLLECSVDRAAA